MSIDELIKRAKETPVTQEQVSELRRRLEKETTPVVSKEWLERSYKI